MGKVIAALMGILAWLALIVAVLYGYFHNIVMLVTHTGDWGIMELARAIGIIAAPLGIIMGYIG